MPYQTIPIRDAARLLPLPLRRTLAQNPPQPPHLLPVVSQARTTERELVEIRHGHVFG